MTVYKLRKLEYFQNLGLLATIKYNGEILQLWDSAEYWYSNDNNLKFTPCFNEYKVLIGFTLAITGPKVGGITLCED